MNSRYIYIGCKHAKVALGDGGHSRRKVEAFAFAIYIKAKLGHSAAKKEQIERFYDELGIGRRRRQRLVSDIVRMGYGKLYENGTLLIGCIKSIKHNNMRVDRKRIADCTKISSLVYIIREIAFINHIHRQSQVNYLKKILQNPKDAESYKKAKSILGKSVEKDNVYETWGRRAISRYLHAGKEKTTLLIKDLASLGIIKIQQGLWEKILDNAIDIEGMEDTIKNEYLRELEELNKKKNVMRGVGTDGKALIMVGNTIYLAQANKYILSNDIKLYKFISKDKKYLNHCHPIGLSLSLCK